ncbi:hypothetical protein L6452_15807 [Arctium lappa]|uniref:Uncharacterized protein n=1 Tax=Arctium lappa TaxID=4217 RepID=A0ACB9CPK2_ARCLA|nr:hypothetical protein L6452_15807 [Arctium lappa]
MLLSQLRDLQVTHSDTAEELDWTKGVLDEEGARCDEFEERNIELQDQLWKSNRDLSILNSKYESLLQRCKAFDHGMLIIVTMIMCLQYG